MRDDDAAERPSKSAAKRAALELRACRRSIDFVRSVKAQTRVPDPVVAAPFDPVAVTKDAVSLTSHAARAAGARVELRAPDSGKLRPVVSQVFPLREGREAFESGTRPHPPGKTVLLVR